MPATATEWIFGGYDPGTEYRSSPSDPNITQRRIKASLTRYRLINGDWSGTYTGEEGTIANAGNLDSTNGGSTYSPSGSAKYICTEDRLDNEAGQGSNMWKQTQVWESFSDWKDWTTMEADLGITNPF